MNKIPKSIDVVLTAPISNNFRCKMACDALDIDIKKKSTHHLHIDGIDLPSEWSVGMIYGASGSGKTTLAKHIFGDDIFKTVINEDEPIINQFDASLTYDECAALLSGIGLNSVPCWVRPVKTLSNGQRARAEAALLMMQHDQDIIVIDEWTSVVDRTVAKGMSHCLQRFARKHKKHIIVLSCHYDVLEWLVPDWLIDCNEQKFHIKQNEDFFFQRRDRLEFTVRKIGRESWKYFSKYHYLSANLPAGLVYFYGLFKQEQQIGFICFANYTPIRKDMMPIYHFNRIVIHPDYQGLSLGLKMINESTRLFLEEFRLNRVMSKFSALPVYKALSKDRKWKHISTKRLMGSMQRGKTMNRSKASDDKTGFREGGIKTFQFEYIGHKQKQ